MNVLWLLNLEWIKFKLWIRFFEFFGEGKLLVFVVNCVIVIFGICVSVFVIDKFGSMFVFVVVIELMKVFDECFRLVVVFNVFLIFLILMIFVLYCLVFFFCVVGVFWVYVCCVNFIIVMVIKFFLNFLFEFFCWVCFLFIFIFIYVFELNLLLFYFV